MASGQPDVIVFELGDGLLGTYGVHSILLDTAIKTALTAVVLFRERPGCRLGRSSCCANARHANPRQVTGPATDNLVGVEIIRPVSR